MIPAGYSGWRDLAGREEFINIKARCHSKRILHFNERRYPRYTKHDSISRKCPLRFWSWPRTPENVFNSAISGITFGNRIPTGVLVSVFRVSDNKMTDILSLYPCRDELHLERLGLRHYTT